MVYQDSEVFLPLDTPSGMVSLTQGDLKAYKAALVQVWGAPSSQSILDAALPGDAATSLSDEQKRHITSMLMSKSWHFGF